MQIGFAADALGRSCDESLDPAEPIHKADIADMYTIDLHTLSYHAKILLTLYRMTSPPQVRASFGDIQDGRKVPADGHVFRQILTFSFPVSHVRGQDNVDLKLTVTMR